MLASELIDTISDRAGREILNRAQPITLNTDTTVFHQGDACENYVIVLSGSIKVFSRAENGREVVLYRVQDGQSCTLTTACLFANNRYPAEGIAETEVKALMIPAPLFNRGIQESADFRQLVFNGYAQKLSDIIALVEDISFGRIDIRLARNLMQHLVGDMVIHTTHQALATELGTAREVVSRQLKEFERRNWVRLHRGSIEIINNSAIEKLAQTPLM
jgi:CRP/FNR family transcriptional regulator